MVSDRITEQEQIQVDKIMRQLGVEVTAEDRRLAADDLKYEMDMNHDLYENADIVAKPKWVEKEEEYVRRRMTGFRIDGFVKPLLNDVYVEILTPEAKSSSIITHSITDMFSNRGKILDMGKKNEEFNIDDEVYIDLRRVRHRFNKNGKVIAVCHYKGILAIA